MATEKKQMKEEEQRGKPAKYKKAGKGNHKKSGNRKPKEEGIPPKNDWSFYAFNEQVARDVASIPFNHVPGTAINPFTDTTSFPLNSTEAPFTRKLPGVLTIDYIPGPGTSADASSGVNMAARQMYSYIRRANSGARNYEAPDLMMYLLAMENVYLRYFEIRRMYALGRSYYYMNRNMPDLLIKACKGQPSNIQASLAQFRYQLNVIREKINSMAVPKGFKSFERRAYVASQVFTDSDSLRSQFYILRQRGYFKYNPTKYDTGGCLEYVELTQNAHTYSMLINQLEDMIEAIITDDDMNTMSGDIIKAFGENGLYTVADVPEDLVLQPIYDEDICAQIENARALRVYEIDLAYPSSSTVFKSSDIFQEANVLHWEPKRLDTSVAVSSAGIANNADCASTILFNSHKSNPTPQDVIEWTRLMTVAKIDEGNFGSISCGLELVVNFTLYGTDVDNTTDDIDFNNSWVISLTDTANSTARYFTILSALAQFDWHPAFRVLLATINSSNTDAPVSNVTVTPQAMDLKVFTILDRDTIANMHTVANYSVYHTSLY